jgi:hypothetical protein
VCEESAHDGVADLQGEAGAEERRRVEPGRDEAEPAQVCDRRGHRERHRLYSLPRERAEDELILRRLWEFGEGQMARLAEELLSNPCLATAFSQVLTRAFEAKARMDRSVQTMLALLNLPSRADVNRLLTKLEAMQGSLVNLNLKVDRLLAERPAPRRRSARKSAARSGEAAE